MRIQSVHVENLGCIETAEVTFGPYTALIGANNAGKSTILKAIDFFFTPAPRIERRHFFKHQMERTISITLRFSDLTPDERREFGSAVIDGTMSVTRTFGGENDGIFFVDALLNPEFGEFRSEANGTRQRGLYSSLRSRFGLPAASSVADMVDALSKWEADNREALVRVKQRGFFGAPNVAAGKLRTKTSVRFIPAVAEVADETGNPKSSPVLAILSDIRKQTIENKPEFQALVEGINNSVSDFVGNLQDDRLGQMSSEMTSLLNQYYHDTEVSAELPPHNALSVTFPPPMLKIRHRAVADGVENVGHGLQRAVLFSVVQFLAQHHNVSANSKETDGEFSEPASDIILLIEEPEIYQHPLKQRIIRDVITQICRDFDKNSGIRIQVIICTHSEKFIQIQNIDALRIVRTSFSKGEYETAIAQLPLSLLRDKLFEARGQGAPMELSAFAASLHVFSEAISEGFFAEKVVLVEGVGDVAALVGAFRLMGRNPQTEGLAIIPVDGKTKLDKPLQSYLQLGIKTYCVFDNDKNNKDKRTQYNILLQKICGHPSIEEFPEGVYGNFTALPGNLEYYLREATGADHDLIRAQIATSFELSADETSKAPATVAAFITIARSRGHSFQLLDQLIAAIDAL